MAALYAQSRLGEVGVEADHCPSIPIPVDDGSKPAFGTFRLPLTEFTLRTKGSFSFTPTGKVASLGHGQLDTDIPFFSHGER